VPRVQNPQGEDSRITVDKTGPALSKIIDSVTYNYSIEYQKWF
jgi:hypothetical protein